MKIYGIAIVLLCLNISIAIVNLSGLFPSSQISYDDSFTSSGRQQAEDFNYSQTVVGQQPGLFTSLNPDTVFVFSQGVSLIFYSTFGVGSLFSRLLGSSPEAQVIGFFLSIPVYVVYIVALIQLISGRRVED